MIEISDEDIAKNEEKFDVMFDDNRRNVLKNMNSIDIVACAGSGKTTLMCSKIDLLTQKQYYNSKGIIVLSLTNVAIEQIRKKLGKNHNIFKYPNYCETIQKFVNTFILNNWYISKYKRKLEIVDTDYFIKSFRKKIGYRKCYFLDNNKFLYDEVIFDGVNIFYGNDRIEDISIGELRKEKLNEYVECLKEAKLELVKNGIFNYRDAFEIGIRYLRENEKIRKYIKNRFEIIFIDEMQDCRKWEKNFLDICFSDVIFQKIGDPNQQIYEETFWNIDPNCVLSINNSLRNSIEIANFSERFQDVHYEINGNHKNNIKVKFIVYKKENILQVKEKFVELIKKENLDKLSGKKFKIIGRIAKKNEKGKITLYDYFNQQVGKIENIFEKTFSNYLVDNKNRIFKTLIDMMYYCYERIDKLNFCHINDKQEFIQKIETYVDKKEIYINLNESEQSLCDFCKSFIRKVLKNIFNDKKYFEIEFSKLINETSVEFENIKEFCKDEINIQINTIAGVKGETHTATLVCETFYKKYDIEYVLDKYIKNNQKNKTVIDLLHTLYVGFTRPTELLCLAIREETYDLCEDIINKLGVEIIKI